MTTGLGNSCRYGTEGNGPARNVSSRRARKVSIVDQVRFKGPKAVIQHQSFLPYLF